MPIMTSSSPEKEFFRLVLSWIYYIKIKPVKVTAWYVKLIEILHPVDYYWFCAHLDTEELSSGQKKSFFFLKALTICSSLEVHFIHLSFSRTCYCTEFCSDLINIWSDSPVVFKFFKIDSATAAELSTTFLRDSIFQRKSYRVKERNQTKNWNIWRCEETLRVSSSLKYQI